MKKTMMIVSIAALLAVGCNSNTKTQKIGVSGKVLSTPKEEKIDSLQYTLDMLKDVRKAHVSKGIADTEKLTAQIAVAEYNLSLLKND